MTAIFTKTLSPTNCRPARIKVYAANGAGSLTIPKSYCEDRGEKEKRPLETSFEAQHRIAAQEFCKKKDWLFEMLGGDTLEGRVFIFK